MAMRPDRAGCSACSLTSWIPSSVGATQHFHRSFKLCSACSQNAREVNRIHCINVCLNILKFLLLLLLVVTDPLGDVLKFIQDYNTKYPSHPVFYQGTYAQALNDAKRELKFLLTYLHSEASSPQIQSGQQRITETVNFCRNTLSNREVVDYINRNMLFWACDVSSPEGYRVSHSINARSYPILVVIALRDNKMTVMGRMEGDCTPDELLTRMQRVVSDNERWLNAARHDRLERSMTQTLRAQQDVAYEESLRADQEKERKRQMERDHQAQIDKEIQAEQDAVERRLELKERLKMELVHQVPSEPPEDGANAISIVFKLPNGMRVTRRFLKTDSLNVSKFTDVSHDAILMRQAYFRTFTTSSSAILMRPMLLKLFKISPSAFWIAESFNSSNSPATSRWRKSSMPPKKRFSRWATQVFRTGKFCSLVIWTLSRSRLPFRRQQQLLDFSSISTFSVFQSFSFSIFMNDLWIFFGDEKFETIDENFKCKCCKTFHEMMNGFSIMENRQQPQVDTCVNNVVLSWFLFQRQKKWWK